MLFVIHYQLTDSRTALNRFLQWTPPFEVQVHYAAADSMSGWMVVDAASVAELLQASAAFNDVMDIEITPVMNAIDAVPVVQEAQAWADDIDVDLEDDDDDDGDDEDDD